MKGWVKHTTSVISKYEKWFSIESPSAAYIISANKLKLHLKIGGAEHANYSAFAVLGVVQVFRNCLRKFHYFY